MIEKVASLGWFVALGLGLSSLAAEQPIVEYQFNGSGNQTMTSERSTASSAMNATLIMRDSAGAGADLHSADALGVSGTPGDRAFDNSAATGMGASGDGGRADKTSSFPSTNNLTSFTIQGWYKTTSGLAIGAGARLMQTDGFELRGIDGASNYGHLILVVNESSASSDPDTYYETEEWVFFAVTYDGTLDYDNVNFYKGSIDTPVEYMGTFTLDEGPTGPNDKLTIGNRLNSNDRPCAGLLDNFRVFGATSGSSGALSQTELENYRASDVASPNRPSQ